MWLTDGSTAAKRVHPKQDGGGARRGKGRGDRKEGGGRKQEQERTRERGRERETETETSTLNLNVQILQISNFLLFTNSINLCLKINACM